MAPPRALLLVAPLALAGQVAVLRALGFVGVSNDDAARALIAWDFARAPTLDATRSSWLPAHSWLLGGLLRAAPSLDLTPVALSLVAGVAASLLVGTLSRRAGASAESSALAALVLVGWRWTAVTSAAGGVPEMPAVALVLGAIALACDDPAREGAARGALAGSLMTLACGHRYEAWFALPGVVFTVAWSTRRPLRAAAFAAASLALPVGWVALNALRRGDPWDFVRRVERFRRDEGLPSSAAVRAMELPRMVLREAFTPAALALAALCGSGPEDARRRVARGMALAALSTLAALEFTALRGGGASHHPERVLLIPAWLLGPAMALGFDRLRERWGVAASAAVCAAALVVGRVDPRGAGEGVDRDAVSVGSALRGAMAADGGEGPWLLEAERQSHLWVLARSGAPERSLRDRSFGGAGPSAESWGRWASAARWAVVSRPDTVERLRQAGFSVIERRGAWTLLRRP